jgi:hypothetical protein
MFETGGHSDLVIRTSDKDFKDHKCVVCPKSPFFEAACKKGFTVRYLALIRLQRGNQLTRIRRRRLVSSKLRKIAGPFKRYSAISTSSNPRPGQSIRILQTDTLKNTSCII